MSILFDGGPKLGPEEFRLLRDYINRVSGISFQEDARFSIERRLRERLAALQLETFDEYYQYLRYHADAVAELERALELLTTNETYFFREEYQLRAFRDEILPEVRSRAEASGSKRLAIWSAGCSTGEEAYTLAMMIADSGQYHDWEVRIFGNDISRRVLSTARKGVYTGASFRVMPPAYEPYFDDVPGGRQVKPHIRAMCHFGYLNLLDRAKAAIVGKVDAIFCRNVLIYFDQEARRRVIETFYERLNPGGYLMLGHSESLLNLSTAFELVHLSTDLVYRRPEATRRRASTGGA